MKKITPEADALIQLTPAEEIEYAWWLEEWDEAMLRSEFLWQKYDEVVEKCAARLCEELPDMPDDITPLYIEANEQPEARAFAERIPTGEFKRLAYLQVARLNHIPVESVMEFLGFWVPKERIN